jgi:hypothetical protein
MASDLADLIRDLEQAPARIARQVAGRMTRAQRELLSIARGVVHVKSGELRDSLYIVAPVYQGATVSEWAVAARSAHGPYEVERGGAHDYVAQTLEDGAVVIDETANDIADLVAQAIVGRG